jgi:hypothetical protein
MADLIPVAQFDNVYQIEEGDPVQGGEGGISNRQAQELANRSQFNKEQNDAQTIAINANTNSISTLDGEAVKQGDNINYPINPVITNAGGSNSGGAIAISSTKTYVKIVATNSSRFYTLPVAGYNSGDLIIIKADSGNTTDVAIVTSGTDLPNDKPLSKRDAAKFILNGSTWEILSLEDL